MEKVSLSRECSTRIAIWRKSQGITQADICKKLNISRVTLSKIEKGKQGITIDRLEKFLILFKTDISNFFLTNFGALEIQKEIKKLEKARELINKELEKKNNELYRCW